MFAAGVAVVSDQRKEYIAWADENPEYRSVSAL